MAYPRLRAQIEGRLYATHKQIAAWVIGGIVLVAVIAQLTANDPKAIAAGLFWTLEGLDGLRYSWAILGEARKDLSAVTSHDINGPILVSAEATLRREALWIMGQTLMVLIGLLSIVVPRLPLDSAVGHWLAFTFFPRFYVATFLMLMHLIWINRRFDSTVNARIRLAREREEEAEAKATRAAARKAKPKPRKR